MELKSFAQFLQKLEDETATAVRSYTLVTFQYILVLNLPTDYEICWWKTDTLLSWFIQYPKPKKKE